MMKRVMIGFSKRGRMWRLPVPGFIYKWLRQFVEIHEPLGIQDIVEIEHIRNGKVIDKRILIGNLITIAGFALVADRLGGVSGDKCNYLAVGTDDTAATDADTALGAEITTGGLARAAATVTRITTTETNDTLQLVYTWTASASHAVVEMGALNAAAAGELLNHKVFSVINLDDTDQFKITAKFPITAA